MVRARLVGLDQRRFRDSDERLEEQRDGRQGLDRQRRRERRKGGQNFAARANWRTGEAQSV